MSFFVMNNLGTAGQIKPTNFHSTRVMKGMASLLGKLTAYCSWWSRRILFHQFLRQYEINDIFRSFYSRLFISLSQRTSPRFCSLAAPPFLFNYDHLVQSLDNLFLIGAEIGLPYLFLLFSFALFLLLFLVHRCWFFRVLLILNIVVFDIGLRNHCCQLFDVFHTLSMFGWNSSFTNFK